MKKLFFTFALAVAATAMHAQMYVAGSIGFDVSGGKTTTKDQNTSIESKSPRTTSFQIAPSLGYYITDKFLIGGRVGIGTKSETTFNNDGGTATKTSSFDWTIVPYARYKCAGLQKFGVWIEGAINIGGSTSKETTGNTTAKQPYTTYYGINFYPVLTYDLTDRLTLETGLNILGLGFNGSATTTKTTVNEQTITTTTAQNSFSFAATTENAIGTLGGISIGISFKL